MVLEAKQLPFLGSWEIENPTATWFRHRGFVGQDDEHYTQAFSTLKPLEDSEIAGVGDLIEAWIVPVFWRVLWHWWPRDKHDMIHLVDGNKIPFSISIEESGVKTKILPSITGKALPQIWQISEKKTSDSWDQDEMMKTIGFWVAKCMVHFVHNLLALHMLILPFISEPWHRFPMPSAIPQCEDFGGRLPHVTRLPQSEKRLRKQEHLQVPCGNGEDSWVVVSNVSAFMIEWQVVWTLFRRNGVHMSMIYT